MNDTKPTPQERKERTAELRKLHQPTFDALGIPDAVFIPKMAHHVKGLEGIHMGFFESELKTTVYTEKVSMQLESEDPDRVLYMVRYNPYYETEYAKSKPMSNGNYRYFVPVDEMEIVNVTTKNSTKKKTTKVTIPKDPDADQPFDQMTMRDYAAIHMQRPVSLKPWLNELIENNNGK